MRQKGRERASERVRERERIFHVCWFIPQMTTMTGVGKRERRERISCLLIYSPNDLCDWSWAKRSQDAGALSRSPMKERAKNWDHHPLLSQVHEQGAEKEAEQPVL